MSPLFGPSASALLSRGSVAAGRITGIAIRYSEEDSPLRVADYAVESNGTVYGIRQELSPATEVRLGMPVQLRVDGKAAFIEWGDIDTNDWKSLRNPPQPGVTDSPQSLASARKRWTAASATLGALTERSVLMGLGTAYDVTIVVTIAGQEPYETAIKGVRPGTYATHLVAPGSVVPVWVKPGRLDKVLIDWAAAAEQTPGVGTTSAMPDSAPRDSFGTGFTGEAAGGASSVHAGGAHMGGVEPGGVHGGGVGVSGPGAQAGTQAGAPQLPAFLSAMGITSTSPDEIDDPVSFETFIAAFKATGSGSIRGPEADALASAVGVPAGEWDAVQARWMKRISRDMTLGMAFGQALHG